jgi:hypothetical protein
MLIWISDRVRKVARKRQVKRAISLKTITKNHTHMDTLKVVFKNEELERNLHILGEEGKVLAEETAKDNAGQNLPPATAQPRAFIGAITGFFNKMVAMIATTLQVDVLQRSLADSEKVMEDRLALNTKELIEVEHRLALKKRARDKAENDEVKSLKKKAKIWKSKRLLTLAIIMIDVVISGSAFMKMGFSLLLSMVIGLGTGTLIYLLSESYRDIVMRAQSKAGRFVIAIAIAFSVAGIYYMLGNFRASGSEGSAGFSHPIFFASLNLFFFVVVSVIAWLNKPTREEYIALNAWQELLGEIKDLESRKLALEKEAEAIKEEYTNKKIRHDRLIEYAVDLERLVVMMYEEAIQTYASNNIKYRSDSVVCSFFNENPIPLTLTYTPKA